MSEGRLDAEYLADVREAMHRVVTYTRDMSYDQFMADPRTQDAVVRNLEVIGEAAKGLSDEVRQQSPHIPWKSMAGMRDKMIHHYFGISYDIVWTVASQEIPALLPKIEVILGRAAE